MLNHLWTKTTLRLLAVFLVTFVGYAGLTRMTFKVPQTVSEGEACSFTTADFTDTGNLRYSVDEAWWTSFVRKQEPLSGFSIGLAVALAYFALARMRQLGVTGASGSLAGGGLIVGLTLSFSCLAPALAAIGVGLFANLGLALVMIPKWLVALNNLLLITYGFLYVSRKAASCPITARHASTTLACGEMTK